MKKALFLDRDGVVNRVVKKYSKSHEKVIDDSPFKTSELFFNEDINGLIAAARKKGYEIILITNQPSILKGEFSMEDYEKITTKICQHLSISRSNIFECFHKEGISLPCECRKPKPGLFLMAKGLFGISLENSIMVGDSFTDIQAAKSAGVGTTIYLRRKQNEFQIGNSNDEEGMKINGPIADYIFDNLSQIQQKIKEI